MASQTSFVKVCNIKPDSSPINTIVKVVSSEVRLQDLGYSNKRFVEVVVGDETGTAVLRVQQPHSQLCAAGATLVVRGARVEMFDGRMRLELGRWSRLTTIEGAAFSPNTSLEGDVSATEFVLVPSCQ
uniref:Single-stranded DNA binding protein Ssb-like OB fold domain-containing protein n=1 Tax=Alexandrium monilatum TaxID=311494 RepID=A0A7S4Q4C3_9DINO